jgi:hypothetical protein
MQFPFDVLISQLAALSVPVGAMILIHKRKLFHPRYRRGLLVVLSAALGLALLFLLGVFQYAEAAVAWRLKHDGITTTARIIAIRKAGRVSRTNIHGSQMYDAICEYSDSRGEKFQGIIKLPEELPHTPDTITSVRYLPADPTVVREEYYVVTARDPGKWVFLWLPWIANAILFAMIYSDVQRRKRRAIMIGRSDFPY